METPANIIEPTEDAVEYGPFRVGVLRPASFQIVGTLTDEEITFEVEDGAGGWRTMTLDDEEVKLRLGHDVITFVDPAYTRINKPVTATACGVKQIS